MEQPKFTVLLTGVEHPSPFRKAHPEENTGELVRFTDTGVYMLKVDGRFISVPQDWAAKQVSQPKEKGGKIAKTHSGEIITPGSK